MLKTQEISDPNSCLNQAEDDEILFVLKANDPIAPETVEFWSHLSMIKGLHLGRVEEALECAKAMRSWRLAHHE